MFSFEKVVCKKGQRQQKKRQGLGRILLVEDGLVDGNLTFKVLKRHLVVCRERCDR